MRFGCERSLRSNQKRSERFETGWRRNPVELVRDSPGTAGRPKQNAGQYLVDAQRQPRWGKHQPQKTSTMSKFQLGTPQGDHQWLQGACYNYIYIYHDIEFPRNHCISKCFIISCSKAPGDPGGLEHSLNAKLRKAIGRWIRMSGSLFLGPWWVRAASGVRFFVPFWLHLWP